MRDMWLAETACLDCPVDRRLATVNGLISRYEEPHRHYHNLSHVAEVWQTLDTHHCDETRRLTLWFATWYHDAIYDPRRTDNEAASAKLAAHDFAAMGVAQVQSDQVVQIILATQTHADGGDPCTAAFLDADRAILGSERTRYQQYVKAVRQEFAFVPLPTFRMGRSRYLWRWLRYKPLFHTSWGQERYETTARANLRWELATWWVPWQANPA